MAGKIRKKKVVDEDVWSLTLKRMRHIYDLFDEVVVSFSGGKDSTAVLNVAMAVAEERGRLPVRAIFYDEEAIPWQTVEYAQRVAADPRIALEWYCLPLECRNACSRSDPTWYPWAPEDRDKWVRPLPAGAITSHHAIDPLERNERPGWAEFAPEHLARSNNTVFLLGIRATESLSRQRAVSRRAQDNYIVNAGLGIAKAYPIYDWQTQDVWTAPAKFGWDYNRAYDLMEMLGISPDEQRCAPPFGEEPLGGLWVFAQAFPEIWDAMLDRAPGVAAAARYAKTELYGYGGVPPKPHDMTWPDYIRLMLKKHPAEVRGHAANSVAELIDSHYKRVSTPIAEKTKHPATGVTWQRLASIAMRGDLKGRRTQMTGYLQAGTEEYDRALVKYEQELAAIEAEGRTHQLLP